MAKSNGKWKLIVAAAAVAAAVCALLIIWLVLATGAQKGSIARVYQDNVLVKEVRLDTLNGEETFRVEGENGAYNDVVFTPEGVRCSEANCPDQVCVHMGTIDSDLLPITCLPHKVVIQIETE